MVMTHDPETIYPDISGDMQYLSDETDQATVVNDPAEVMDNTFDHIYDDGFSHEVAGHVEAAALGLDGAVSTPTGPDIGWEGDRTETRGKTEHLNGVGPEHVDAAIGKAVEDSQGRHKRTNIDSASDSWRADTWTLLDNKPVLIVDKNRNRASVCITNQGATTVFVGPNSLQGPAGMCAIPPGVGRTFTHRGQVWVAGQANGAIDMVEENY